MSYRPQFNNPTSRAVCLNRIGMNPINVEATLRKYLAGGDIAGEDEDLLASIFTDAADAIAGLRIQLVSLRSATIEECAKIVEDFPYQMLHMWERPGGPPGNGYRETTHEDISAAVRALLKQTDEIIKGE